MKDDEHDIWALDEVHFQQYGSRCRMWIPPEVTEPVLMHHPTRDGVGYYGAVWLRDGKFVYQSEWDKFNGETFFSFLKHLRKVSSHSGHKVIVINDIMPDIIMKDCISLGVSNAEKNLKLCFYLLIVLN